MDEYHSAQKLLATSTQNPDDVCLAAMSATILQLTPSKLLIKVL
jgi:hypothetical protein